MWRKQKPTISINNRLKYLALGVLVVAGIIGTRLFFLQVLNHQDYIVRARSQQERTILSEPERGDIYFRDDKNNSLVTAATTENGHLLYIDNRYLKDFEKTYTALSAITTIDQTLFAKIVQKKDDPYEVLKPRISLAEGARIRALSLPGVGLVAQSWRLYSGNTFASHVLGFVSHAAEHSTGQYGAEKYYDQYLQGIGGDFVTETDGRGFLFVLRKQLQINTKSGKDLTLTIEPVLQQASEVALEKLQKQWHSTKGGIIIVEPKTGKIKALAAFPVFNPNEYYKENNLTVFLNPFVESIFELGSVFKPLTMAAALDQGKLTPDTTYIDYGEIKIGAATIKNFDGKARGLRTMTQVLEESLNTGAVFAMQRLGMEHFKTYFYNYGLQEKLGIDLPGEVAGNLRNLDSGREIEFATASFGQGIAVSPLEFTLAISSLANGGELMRPYINEDLNPQVIRRVLKPETSETITRMLVDVVDTALIGGKAKKPGYSIAAKTGTAQIPKTDSKGYSEEYLHSFFGYFPAYNPQFLIFMFIERPQGVRYASQSLTESFSGLVDFLINYYTIPPDRAVATEKPLL